MNQASDVREITRVVLPLETDDQVDTRGWWPVLAFTDDVRPIVLEINVN